jgi:hypothetical protein
MRIIFWELDSENLKETYHLLGSNSDWELLEVRDFNDENLRGSDLIVCDFESFNRLPSELSGFSALKLALYPESQKEEIANMKLLETGYDLYLSTPVTMESFQQEVLAHIEEEKRLKESEKSQASIKIQEIFDSAFQNKALGEDMSNDDKIELNMDDDDLTDLDLTGNESDELSLDDESLEDDSMGISLEESSDDELVLGDDDDDAQAMDLSDNSEDEGIDLSEEMDETLDLSEDSTEVSDQDDMPTKTSTLSTSPEDQDLDDLDFAIGLDDESDDTREQTEAELEAHTTNIETQISEEVDHSVADEEDLFAIDDDTVVGISIDDQDQAPTESKPVDYEDKLAEIDAMMDGDGEDLTSTITHTSTDYDMSMPPVSKDEELQAHDPHEETVVTDISGLDLDDQQEPQEQDSHQHYEGEGYGREVSEQEKNQYQDYVKYHEDELSRVGATITALKNEREDHLSQISTLTAQVENEKSNALTYKAQLDEKAIELNILRKRSSKSSDDLKYKYDLVLEQKELIEEKYKLLLTEFENLKREKRVDVHRVREREKELEEKLDLLRTDADIQIQNRDKKILHLKRKIDMLEFDIESIQTQGKEMMTNKHQLEKKMENVIQTLRTAITDLEDKEMRQKLLKKNNLDV